MDVIEPQQTRQPLSPATDATQPGAAAGSAGQTSALAIISLVCSLLGFFLGVTSVIAIVTGHMARSEIRRKPGMRGNGLATTGIVLGYIGLVLFVVALVAVGWTAWLGNGFVR